MTGNIEKVTIRIDTGIDALDKLRNLLDEARESFGGGDCNINIENGKLELVNDYGEVYYEISF